MRRTVARWLTSVGEVLAAPLSFMFYRTARVGMRRLLRLHDRAHPAEAAAWQVLDGSTVGRPFKLLALMTSAPRWNTHAVIALAGPLQVRRTVGIDTAVATTSATSWTVVVHAEPAHQMVASIGPVDAGDHARWRTLVLPPGTYRLALRYYQWSETAELPAVEVDGTPVVSPLKVPSNANEFYHDLAKRSTVLYLCLHSYVCTLLRYRRWFASSFVEREYLPAGNPQTSFSYGFWPAGSRLAIELGAGLLDTHDVYLTAYNRASFPVIWYPLTEISHRTPHITANGTYLIRVQAKSTVVCTGAHATVRVHTERSPAT